MGKELQSLIKKEKTNEWKKLFRICFCLKVSFLWMNAWETLTVLCVCHRFSDFWCMRKRMIGCSLPCMFRFFRGKGCKLYHVHHIFNWISLLRNTSFISKPKFAWILLFVLFIHKNLFFHLHINKICFMFSWVKQVNWLNTCLIECPTFYNSSTNYIIL